MSIIALPVTFADGVILTAGNLNSDFLALYNDYNGGITDANIASGANINGGKLLAASIGPTQLAALAIIDSKIDYGSALVLRIGPNAPVGGSGRRVATGSKAIGPFVAGTGVVTITFATDSDNGNPNFSAVPRVMAILKRTNAANNYEAFISTAPTSTSVGITVRSSDGADVTTQAIEWIAIGDA